jgi:hypothetical protein
MFRPKRLILLLLPAMLLSACQLFEPLPTLPAILTLEPLASELAPGLLPASSTPEALADSPQVSLEVPTQPAATTAVLPVVSPTTAPTQAQQPVLPSATNLPAATATRPAPTSAPSSTWHGLPIMPAAREGAEDNGAYSYTVNASVEDVQAYYDQQMPLAGWAYFASGEGEAGNLLLMYQKDNITATIGVIAQGGSTLVLLVAE